jgi:type IV pilus assembly protein PilY1
MNYLNKFGYTSKSYKSKDPVGELYYAALRYFKNLGNVSAYTNLSTAGSSDTASRWLDGFPMITAWDDPIVYTCQSNFILGIGDVNTHRDANLYGSTIRSSLEPSLPSEVSADTSVDVATATNMVGKLEGKDNLANYYDVREYRYPMPLLLPRRAGLRLPHQGHPFGPARQADRQHLLDGCA